MRTEDYRSRGSKSQVSSVRRFRVQALDYRYTILLYPCSYGRLTHWVVDDHDRLHVWDLAGSERPRLQRITGFGQSVKYAVTLSYVRVFNERCAARWLRHPRIHM